MLNQNWIPISTRKKYMYYVLDIWMLFRETILGKFCKEL